MKGDRSVVEPESLMILKPDHGCTMTGCQMSESLRQNYIERVIGFSPLTTIPAYALVVLFPELTLDEICQLTRVYAYDIM